MRNCDWAIGTLRKAGFSIEMAYHAFLTMDSYIYGFTLQEVNWPFDKEERPDVLATIRPQIPADEFPYVTEIMGYVLESSTAKAKSDRKGAVGYECEFEFGLDLILDGLERVRDTA